MPIGTKSDIVLFHEEAFFAGMQQTLDQNINLFNAASGGAITLETRRMRGEYDRRSFLAQSAMVSRRDTTVTTALTDIPTAFDEEVGVKLSRKAHTADTGDKWRKLGETPALMSLSLGRMYGEQKLQDMLNAAVLAVETALQGTAALNFTAVPLTVKTLTHGHIVSAKAKRGDQSSAIAVLLGHSKPLHDLLGQAITDNVDGVANIAVINGATFGVGSNLLMSDIPSLVDTQGSLPNTYNTLGLVPGAVSVIESDQEEVMFDRISGAENIVFRFQAEFAFTVRVLGYKWNIGAGGANPTSGALGTTTNWVATAVTNKQRAGVRIVTN